MEPKWTPGPWTADGSPMNRIVWSSSENRVCFMAHSGGLDDARDIATSNLVAAAPDLHEATIDTAASLAAAINLLERGGKAAKKGAPSDKMFDQMLADYRASLERARAALAKARGEA